MRGGVMARHESQHPVKLPLEDSIRGVWGVDCPRTATALHDIEFAVRVVPTPVVQNVSKLGERDFEKVSYVSESIESCELLSQRRV